MNHMLAHNLVLGSAQLGMTYGIANSSGQPQQHVATDIIRAAWECGVDEIDTAQGYGDSENVIGHALTELGIAEKVKVISKIHPRHGVLGLEDFKALVAQSLQKLKISSLYGLMLHNEELLQFWNEGLWDVLEGLKECGYIQHIGASIYSPEKARAAISLPGMDFIQVPTNILDRRFENAQVFSCAEAMNKKVYIRSVYLQGLLVLPKEKLPEKMSYIVPTLEKLDAVCEQLHLTRQELALGYIKTALPNAKLILGVETPLQMQKNVETWLKSYAGSLKELVRREFVQVSDDIIQPLRWPMRFWPT